MNKKITVETTSEGSYFVSDAFFALGLNGVSIDDPNDVADVLTSDLNWDYVEGKLLTDKDRAPTVSGIVTEEECENKLTKLKEILSNIDFVDLGSLNITVSDVNDVDWFSEWKKYYQPIEAGEFVVVPVWLPYDGYEGKTIIRIDPSMAFGTGEHESTKLCLTLMSDVDFNDKYVIDVGTGSGILGIGAIKRGARECFMCDIDSLSIKSATENATLNGVTDKAVIKESDLVAKATQKGKIILANLTADILVRLSNAIGNFIEDGGYLICSGIIHSRKQEVIDAYEKLGFKLEKDAILGEWDGIRFVYGKK